jgi:dTDP-3-amino-2,3,6-trideoxy-4-keto-D-glucose/dTDP-3-amino-3,4,6-trideoxy-alpha-D-glucose/dTDP-2,6-dideoxy-D-kanosamine transaminase
MQVKYAYLTQQFARGTPLRNDIETELAQVVDAGDFTLGKAVEEFEAAFAAAVGARYAVGVRSGTDALYLALKALGIGLGDKVATVPNTFPATVGAIIQAGAAPVFVDVSPDNYLLPTVNPQFPTVEGVKAIIPVDWGGDFVPLTEERIGLINNDTKKVTSVPFIVHDACQAVGTTWKGKGIGGLGKACAFSFHPLKTVHAWGDGGAVTTNDPFVAQKIRSLRNHGLLDRDTWLEPGINGRMETIQAVVCKHSLKTLPDALAKRRRNAALYDETLSTIKGITTPKRSPDVTHSFHLYVVQADRRDELVKYLAANEIETKVHYPKPLHLQPAMHGMYAPGAYPVAEAQAQKIISLPVHEFLTPAQIEFVNSKVRAFYS